MTNLAYCPEGGWLVSRSPVPDDPADHWTWGVGDPIGCNNLVCLNCGSAVRSAPNIKPAVRSLRGKLKELADSQDWSALPFLKATWACRLYACTCCWRQEVSRQLVQDEDPDVRADTRVPWACAGHPPPTLPLTVDGLTIDANTDFQALVKRILDEGAPDGAPVGWSTYPASWLGRIYYRLRELPESVALARAAGDLLFSSRTEHVAGALFFYRRWPEAPGGERVIDLADRAGAASVFRLAVDDRPPFESPAATLAVQARRSETPDSAVLRHLEDALCAPGGAGMSSGQIEGLFELLSRHDPEFLAKSAPSVSRNDQDLAEVVLRTLRKTGRDELVVVAGHALIGAGGYEVALERFLVSAFSRDEPWTPVLRLAMAEANPP